MDETIEERIPSPDMPEDGPALAAFEVYLTMGPKRSLSRLCKELGHPKSYERQLQRWSSQYGWQARCAAHDVALAQEAIDRESEDRLADIKKRRDERLKIASVMRQKAAKYLVTHDLDPKEVTAPDGKKTYVSAADPHYLTCLVRMLEYADRAERLDLGEATDRTEVSNKGPSIGELSDEDLVKAVEATLQRVRATPEGEDDAE